MDQSLSLTAQLGFDENEWIDQSCQLYPSGANASEPDANQVAHDDRTVDGILRLDPAPLASIDAGRCGHIMPGIIDATEPATLADHSAHSNFNHSSHFIFKSRSVVLEDNSIVANTQKPPKPNTGIRCEHPGCSYRGTFNRKYDLQRHMIKHQNAPKERCPINFCDREFRRYDKLLLHLQTTHTDEEEATCPVSSCSLRVPFMLLSYHMYWHPSVLRREDIIVKACISLGGELRSCPISSCRHSEKKLPANTIQRHLQEHDLNERSTNSNTILDAGYHPVSLGIRCPLCPALLQDTDAFTAHCQDEHILNSRLGFRGLTNKSGWHKRFWRKHPTPWDTELYRKEPNPYIPFLCPYSDYASHGLAILRLWPQFAQHPLFDEFNPKLVAHNGARSTIQVTNVKHIPERTRGPTTSTSH